jgi:hypothetical protein
MATTRAISTVKTFFPRISKTIPHEVQRHLQLIYLKLNNHAQAFQALTGSGAEPAASTAVGQSSASVTVASTQSFSARPTKVGQYDGFPGRLLRPPKTISPATPAPAVVVRGGVPATAHALVSAAPAAAPAASAARAYRAITSAYSVQAGDEQIDCTSGTFTVTLPTAAGITGQVFSIKNSGNGKITLVPAPGETIDGGPDWVLKHYVNIAVMSAGTHWIIVSRY